ncbi:MAG: UPF0104 family protein [Candidatus Auribacter fodinae]|jgi:uncharacterized protein (TIRG00374 family)|uniref:UPF0104 family protein n=1 Tax=Candidatus Auribacter fodinae TaxID=2093366 RepID=A0A3A4R6U1_9BACT|nr:MAG: UPF0104 family protein [Candidatus Auribacter fodinae]
MLHPAKKYVLFLMRTAISAAIIVFLGYKIDVSHVFEKIIESKFEFFIILGAIDLAAYFLRALRWQIVLRIWDIHVSTALLFIYLQGGRIFDYLLPSSIGGDVYRVYLSAKKSNSTSKAVLGIVLDRLTGMSAGFILAGIGVAILYLKKISVPHMIVVLVFIAVWFILMGILFSPKLELMVEAASTRSAFWAKLNTFFSSMVIARSNPRQVIYALLISFFIKSQEIFVAYFVSHALGLSVPFLYCMAFVPVIGFIIVAPVSISGIGVRESLYIFFFTAIGLTMTQAFSLSITVFAWMACMGAAGGSLYLLWWTFSSHKKSQ